MTNKNDPIINDFLEKFVDLMRGELTKNLGIKVEHDKENNLLNILAGEFSTTIDLANVVECHKGTRNGVVYEILDLVSKIEDISAEDRFTILGHIKTKLMK